MEAKTKWQDTIMNDQQIIDAQNQFIAEHPDIILQFPLSGWIRDSALLEAQAEATWEAAYQAGQEQGHIDGTYKGLQRRLAKEAK